MGRVVRSLFALMVMCVMLLGCTSSATDDRAEPGPSGPPTSEPPGVTLELASTHGSNGCCRVFTLNPGETPLTVACGLVALDPAGRLIYTAVVPPKAPGHLRSSGFEAQPGRHGHGVLDLPIDLEVDSYTAPCRPAAWHGGAPI